MSSLPFGYGRTLAYIPLLFLLTACFGSTAHTVRSEAQLRAEALLTRAIRAEKKGDAPEALRLLSESLAVSASIEDTPSKTVALINIARLHRLHHEYGQAATAIDAALLLPIGRGDISSEAAREKGLLLLATHDAAAALPWAVKSAETAPETLRGRCLNLLGRIKLATGAMAAAQPDLEKALAENRKNGDGEEEANSLRMLGISARIRRDTEASERLLSEALDLDKRIGASAKIAADLEELAQTARAAGRLTDAAAFLERAGEVHLNAGRYREAAMVQEALAEIAGLQGDASRAGSAGDAARKLLEQAEDHPDVGTSATTNPSSRP